MARQRPTDTATEETHERSDDDVDCSEGDDAHLADVEDGCGCTEVWEHLSEHRDNRRGSE